MCRYVVDVLYVVVHLELNDVFRSLKVAFKESRTFAENS